MEGGGRSSWRLSRPKVKSLFKRYLLVKYMNEEAVSKMRIERMHWDIDPTERLTEHYCINKKRTSEISLFQEQLLKTELTDEYLFSVLREKLNEDNLLEDLIDVEFPERGLDPLDLGEDFISMLIAKLKTGKATDEFFEKLETTLKKFSELIHSESRSRSKVRKPTKREESKKKRKHTHSMKSYYETGDIFHSLLYQKMFKDSGLNFHDTIKDNDSSSSLTSDEAARNRLNKLHYYPLALDLFGNRIENFKLPGESVNRMLGRLAKIFQEPALHPTEITYLGTIIDEDNEQKTNFSGIIKAADLSQKDKDVESSKATSHEPDIEFESEKIKKLTIRKENVEKYIISEDFLLNKLKKLKPDHKGWRQRMLLTLKMIKEGNLEYLNDINLKIENLILMKKQEEERSKIKYWELLHDDEPSNKKVNVGSTHNKSDRKDLNIHEKKKFTYKTINEFMFSRNYDDAMGLNSSKDEECDEMIPLDVFKWHVFDSMDRILTQEEVTEFMGYFDDPLNNIFTTDSKPETSFFTEMKKVIEAGKNVEVFPEEPYLSNKRVFFSRLSQVRGLITSGKSRLRTGPPERHSYPFSSKTSRGLSPIKKPTQKEKKKKTSLTWEERNKFLKVASSDEGGKPNNKKQSKRLCERPLKQTSFPWEPPKVLGRQILPGTDLFIEAPKIKDLKDIEDSWKYNVPPFHYMNCDLPQDTFETVANKILQKEILEQELMDLRREELEKMKSNLGKKFKSKGPESNKMLTSKTKLRTNPPPWHYDVRRWPKEAQHTRLQANTSTEKNNFISRTLRKYKSRVNYKKC